MKDRFPWLSHRTLAEVELTKWLQQRQWPTWRDRLWLKDLLRKAAKANGEQHEG